MLKNKSLLILILFVFFYFFLFSYLSIYRFYSFGAYYFDLGIMDQVAYNTSKGRLLEFTNPHLGKNTLRFAVHFDPILGLFAPFYKIFSGPEVLLVFQSLALALSAIFIFKIASLVLKDNVLSLLLSLIYLIFYPLHFINLFDFHAVSLSILFLLSGFYFLIKNEYKINKNSLFLFFLATLTKENVILVVGLIFLLSFFITRRKKTLFFFIALLIYFLAVIKLIIPYFAEGSFFAERFYSLSLSANVRRFFSQETFNYLNKVFQPLLYLPIFSPLYLLPAFSEILKNTLSSNPNLRNLYFHYLSATIPFLFISTIFSLKKLKSFYLRRLLVYALLFFNIFLSLRLSPLKGFFKRYTIDNAKFEFVQQLRKEYGEEVVLSSTGQLAPFFTQRRVFIDFLFDPAFSSVGISKDDIIRLSKKYTKADVVIIAKWEIKTELTKLILNLLKTDPNFRLVKEKVDIQVYERKK